MHGRQGAAGSAQEEAAVELGEGQQSEACGESEHCSSECHDQLRDGVVEPEPLQESLEREPLADEAPERWHCRQGQDGQAEAGSGDRDPRRQPSERQFIAAAGGLGDPVGAEEGRSLRQSVHDHVERGRQKAGGGELRGSGALTDEGHPESDQGDSAVLHAGEAEEALHLVLHDRVEDPGQRSQAAQHDQHLPPPHRRRPQHSEDEAPEAVEAGVEGDGDRRRRRSRSGGVEARQRPLEGEQTDLRPEADQKEDERHVAGRAKLRSGVRPVAEPEAAGLPVQECEGREQGAAADLAEGRAEVAGEERAGVDPGSRCRAGRGRA